MSSKGTSALQTRLMLQQGSKPILVNDGEKYVLLYFIKAYLRSYYINFLIMVTQVSAFQRVLLASLFVLLSQDVAAYKAVNAATSSGVNITQTYNNVALSGTLPVIRDFDKLRGFQSYDPATDKWSTVEDFETVDILEDTIEQRVDHYIYRSFWAYDMVANCWYKVDIRDYGYKLSQLAATGKTEPQEESPNESSSFWKNWVLGLRGGVGPTFYKNKITHCSITERDGEAFFLQTVQGERDSQSYKIHWFGAGYTMCGNPRAGSQGALDIKKAAAGRSIIFRGRGWNIPITLFTHYTFFKRLRLGAGYELEINYLKELIPQGDASHLRPFKVQRDHQWFFNMGWFGLVGFKMMHAPHQDIIVDFQFGKNYNVGTTLKNLFGKRNHLYDGYLLGVGVSYERKMNNYFKFLTRLAGDWKVHNDTPPKINDSRSSVELRQIAIHLDLGIQVSFGQDTAEDVVAEGLDVDHDLTQSQQKPVLQSKKPNLRERKKKLHSAKKRRNRPR